MNVLSVPEAAKELGLTRAAVWQFIDAGLLKATMVGRVYVIERADWERFKAKRAKSRPTRPPRRKA